MHAKMSSTERPIKGISEFLLFTVTDGGQFGFYALQNSARLFKRGVGVFFYKYLKLPKTTVKAYLPKFGHRILVLDNTIALTIIHPTIIALTTYMYMMCTCEFEYFCKKQHKNAPELYVYISSITLVT